MAKPTTATRQAQATDNGQAPGYIIPAALLLDILNYLARQPYADVFQLIGALQQLPQEEVQDAGSG